MPKKMLIDAAHPEETRVVVLDGTRVDDFDFEVQSRKQLRGNIYLAKVTRVEPSLQAAFVEYGGNRHGFLAFGEIHPDYYQIPTADREALKAEVEAAESEGAGEDGEGGPEVDDEEAQAELEERRRRILTRKYRIQEVIRRRQVMLVQVVKEERGTKGAALTTYLSLAGRYCVLMPNTGRGGGISRKIPNGPDRKRLKKIAGELEVPRGMGLIIRTAGAKRTKTEIKRDYEYLLRAWENIRDCTLRSIAPALIYEESSLVKRAIRDLYDKEVDEIHVDGDAAYREAKDFVRMLMPSHAKKVHAYKDGAPILIKHGVERQLESVFSPVVNLRSGGYLVINQTEALVSIDVNSGRATRERNIEQTALKTNLEAAEEAARQMRLRDLAGLIVIDFIDMEEAKNDRAVEKRMKDCLRHDRARVQMGKISPFGLLELSRQRRRTGILEGSSHVCPHCQGTGRVRSVESSALRVLRVLEEECAKRGDGQFEVRAPTDVALYLLNEKRAAISRLESSRGVEISIAAVSGMITPDFEIMSRGDRRDIEGDLEEDAAPRRPAPAQSRREAPRAVEADQEEDKVEIEDDADEADLESDAAPERQSRGPRTDDDADGRRRRRRGRRGGKRRRDEEGAEAGEAAPAAERPAARAPEPRRAREADTEGGDRRRRGRRRRRRGPGLGDSGEFLDMLATDPVDLAPAVEPEPEPVPVPAPAPAPVLAFEAEPPTAPRPAPAAVEDIRFIEEAAATAETAPEPEPEPEPDYAPDSERRARFFERMSRWGKKSV
jgi:ribonuclease E